MIVYKHMCEFKSLEIPDIYTSVYWKDRELKWHKLQHTAYYIYCMPEGLVIFLTTLVILLLPKREKHTQWKSVIPLWDLKSYDYWVWHYFRSEVINMYITIYKFVDRLEHSDRHISLCFKESVPEYPFTVVCLLNVSGKVSKQTTL